MAVMTSFGLWRYRRRPTGYYTDLQPKQFKPCQVVPIEVYEQAMAEAVRDYPQHFGLEGAVERETRAKQRGKAFVSLYAAAKQLVDNYPKRFPYLEFDVRAIEEKGLAPKLDNRGTR